jgi:hypothetical protein
MTAFLGASLGLQCGVSPYRVSAAAARRSQWSALAVDGLLDDRQRCTTTGDGEVGRRPEVSAHAGADELTGEFAAHSLSATAFEALERDGDRQGGRASDEQVHVVGFAVELDQLDVEVGADGAHGGFGECCALRR